jgi:hypothetical protein
MLPNIAAGPIVYPTVLARFGRFLPELMPRVAQLRHEENKKLAHERAENPLPHIPHSLRNVPSENLGSQRRMQDKMRMALDDMHRQIIDDVSAFIDNKMKDIGWLTSPVNIDYIASDLTNRTMMLAYDKDQLMALLKLLTFFAIVINKGEVPEELLDNVKEWYNEAAPLLTELKVPKRDFKYFDPAAQGLRRAGKLRPPLPDNIRLAMKEVRKDLRTDQAKKGFSTSREYTKLVQDMLTRLYSYFFSYSEPAWDFLTQNIHSLGDSELNNIMEPVFHGNPKIEADKLASMVRKHGGSGYKLTKDQSKTLMERNAEAHKALGKQSNVVRAAARTLIKKTIRASGQPLMRAREVIKLLQDNNLPSVGHFIPKGFDPGYYDQDMNMYSPQKKKLQTNVAGDGWIKWHPAGSNLKSVAMYQTPYMAKPAGLYTLEHTTGARQEKKYGAVEENKKQLAQLAERWYNDSQSRDPEKQLLGYMAMAMYYLSMRVGSPNARTDDEQTFGLTTFQVGHVKRQGDSIIFDFRGKSGMGQQLKLSPTNTPQRNLVDFVKSKTEGRRRVDPLWVYGPQHHTISAARINEYLKSTGWVGSAKGMRTLRGTRMMEVELEKLGNKQFSSRQNAISWMENALTQVGNALGHKRTTSEGTEVVTYKTAAESYVNPKLIIKFFRQHNVNPLPSWIQKYDKGGDEDDED